MSSSATRWAASFAAALLTINISFAEELSEKESSPQTDFVIKGATFETRLFDLPSSGAVLDEEILRSSDAQHLQDVLERVPNLMWSGGTNRPRFFQVRGIGELEQYEGAPNPSVGVIVDGVDLSGLGTIGTLFDIDQVEVLRGPQSIRYGSSALAGIIALESTDPSGPSSGLGEATVGNDDTGAGGFAVGGTVPGTNGTVLFRASLHRYESDGFRRDLFLGRDDTMERNETTSRMKLSFLPTPELKVDLAMFYIDVDNGYDAFAIDNGFETQSDRPGRDEQGTGATALTTTYRISEGSEIFARGTFSRSNVNYSFDGDWGNNPFWAPYDPYDYFSVSKRARTTGTGELRLQSISESYRHGETWRYVGGAFGQRLNEDLDTTQSSNGEVYDFLGSDYQARTSALFGLVEAPLASGTALSFSLRGERRLSDYNDTRTNVFSPEEKMWGGALSLTHDLRESLRSYVTLSRGFKGGGFNTAPAVRDEDRTYSPESLWNLETGLKGSFLRNTLDSSISLFHMWRNDQQVKFGVQDDPSDPLAFTYLTDNAARGVNYGIEADAEWRVHPRVKLFASGALLETEFTDYDAADGALEGRNQSHAPGWQYHTGARVQITEGLYSEVRVAGTASYYFDDAHNERSDPYHLAHATIGYRWENWELRLWGRNVFDERYAVRGFFFGNEPPDFESKQYVQRGDPVHFGSTLEYRF